jgi:predicted dehydrogenase
LNNSNVEMLRGFLQAIHRRSMPPAGAADARAALAAVLAIYRSAASGRAVDIRPPEVARSARQPSDSDWS